MNNDQDSARSVHTEGYVSWLSFGIGILDGYREGIAKCLLGSCEADVVLGQVSLCLGRVELDVHQSSMHIVCILSRRTLYNLRAVLGSPVVPLVR